MRTKHPNTYKMKANTINKLRKLSIFQTHKQNKKQTQTQNMI